MDNLNFLPADNYPVSSETLDFLQSMIKLVQKLTLLGGTTNYILEGCVKSGNNYSKGTVIINGEIFEVAAGVAQSSGGKDWVCLKETTVDALVYDTPYPNVQTLRTVEHGIGTESVTWAISDFITITTMQELLELIRGLRLDLGALDTSISSRISNLTTAVSGKAPASHTHAIANVTGLQDALNGKSATGHGHSASEISGLPKGIHYAASTGYFKIDLPLQLYHVLFPTGLIPVGASYRVVGNLLSSYDGGAGIGGDKWKTDMEATFLIREQTNLGFYIAIKNTGSPYSVVDFQYFIVLV